MTLVCVSPTEAKEASLALLSKRRHNLSDLASKLGVSRQALHQWVSQKAEPRDQAIWLNLAQALGIEPNAPVDDLWKIVVDFAIDVMAESEVPSLRNAARHVLREIRGKYGDIY